TEVLTLTAGTYRYDDDKPAPTVTARAQPQTFQRVPAAQTLASASKEAYALTNQATAVSLALGSSGAKRLTRALVPRPGAPRTQPRMFVTIQGISAKKAEVPVHYFVYLKAKEQKAEESGVYIGTIQFFGRTEHLQADEHAHGDSGASFDQKFEVTSALKKLSK